MNEKARVKLVAELDEEQKWFQKAARHYKKRRWAQDVRRALDIRMGFMVDELDAKRAAIYRAEEREESGMLTMGELEVLAEAMECKLVYAIVPRRGTVAEAAEHRRAHPRKTRTQREKETEEYRQWYDRQVEKLREKQDPVAASIAEWGKELRRKRGTEGTERQGSGVRDQGTERQGSGVRDQGSERQGLGTEIVVRPPGAQRIRDAVAGAMKELGPEKELAVRRTAEKARD